MIRAGKGTGRRARIWLVMVAGLPVFFALGTKRCAAQEPPYFVTYSHAMEEPGNLEVEFKGTQAAPKGDNAFGGGTVEFEYGAKAWWTTEVYLSGQTTAHDSTIFTGFRWENRFRPLLEEHWINPVLYFEYENTSADRSFLEVVGNDSVDDLRVANAQARPDVEREMEMKLILSSDAKGWNFSENFITEKNLQTSEAWEFGYALGASRPLTLRAGARACVVLPGEFCRGRGDVWRAGDAEGFGLKATSHYVAPTAQWNLPRGPSVMFSPGFGLNDNSLGMLWRVGVQYELQQFFGRFHRAAGVR